MNVTDISVNGLNSIRAYEGRALRAYQDSVGVWTVGYGLTHFDKGLPFKVGPGTTITAEQAEWFLYRSLRQNYLPAVEARINQTKVAHPQGAIDGGASMHFNTGGISKATWPAKLNAGDISGAEAAFKSWNKAGGRVLGGLVRRRASEWNIIARQDYGHLTGPELENGPHGTQISGHGSLLTALPTEPGSVEPGNVHVHGVPDATPAPGHVLKEGDTGPDVVAAQQGLNKAGIPTVVNGQFDSDMVEALKKFQGLHPQITADGTIGPATRATLGRTADMRERAGRLGKLGTASGAGVAATLHNVSSHTGQIVLAVAGIIVVVAVAHFVWTYRHELRAQVNKMLGRTVL